MTNRDISDVFSIFHDGVVSGFEKDSETLILKIDCEYLAERIDKSFTTFYVHLIGLRLLEFVTWPNPFDLPKLKFTKPDEIFKAELEILSCETRENGVEVFCNQHDTSFDYCGGNLFLDCNAIKILDEKLRELSIEQLDKISNDYWRDFSS